MRHGAKEGFHLRPVYSDATQLNSTSNWVELRHYRHLHRRNSTVSDDRQCNWPSWTAYSQSARSLQLLTIRVRVRERTQVFAIAPIKTKRVRSAALWCVIYQPATFISWKMFSSAAAFLHGRWRLWSICHINRHVFSIILLTFLQILHSKIPYPGKLVKTRHIWRHDLQTGSTGLRRSELIGDSCSRCERVDNSTSSWVELCRYKRAFTRELWKSGLAWRWWYWRMKSMCKLKD